MNIRNKKIEHEEQEQSQTQTKMEDYKSIFEIYCLTETCLTRVTQNTKFRFVNTLTGKDFVRSRRTLAVYLSKLLFPAEAKEAGGYRFIMMPEQAAYWVKTTFSTMKPYWNRHMGIYQIIDFLAFGKAYDYHEIKGVNEYFDKRFGKLLPYSGDDYLQFKKVELYLNLRKENLELKLADVKLDTFNDLPIIKQYINHHTENCSRTVPQVIVMSINDQIKKLQDDLNPNTKLIKELESYKTKDVYVIYFILFLNLLEYVKKVKGKGKGKGNYKIVSK
jgi:hypothetical protein